MFYGLSEF